MGDEQRRRSDLELNAADLLAQLGAHLGVERGQRLVEQEHARFDRECPGERDALLLAAGQLAGIAVGMCREPDELEHLLGTG